MTDAPTLTINEAAHGDQAHDAAGQPAASSADPAKHPCDPDLYPHAAAASRDASDLEIAEVASRLSFDALDLAGKVRLRAGDLLASLQAQVRANAPVTDGIVAQAEAIFALVR